MFAIHAASKDPKVTKQDLPEQLSMKNVHKEQMNQCKKSNSSYNAHIGCKFLEGLFFYKYLKQALVCHVTI